jgi:hypothetical protein
MTAQTFVVPTSRPTTRSGVFGALIAGAFVEAPPGRGTADRRAHVLRRDLRQDALERAEALVPVLGPQPHLDAVDV